MPVKLKRSIYYIFSSISGIFFVVNLYSLLIVGYIRDVSLVRSSLLLLGFLTLYISKADKDYLIKSIILRAIIGIAGLSGLVLIILTLNLE